MWMINMRFRSENGHGLELQLCTRINTELVCTAVAKQLGMSRVCWREEQRPHCC